MDALDREIESRRNERAKLVEKIRGLDVTISALEKASALRPTESTENVQKYQAGVVLNVRKGGGQSTLISGATLPRSNKGGRKIGDINKKWREVLKLLHEIGHPQKYESIMIAVEMYGLTISGGAVRDRIRNFVRTGLMAGDAKSGFIVTQDAAERFSFAKANEPSEGGSDEDAEGDEAPPAFELQPSPDGA